MRFGIESEKAGSIFPNFAGLTLCIDAQAFDQKVIYSWPQKTGSRWTLPAMEIQQAATKAPEPRYMGVMDHNFVCTWTQRDPSIDTHKKGVRSIPLKMHPSSGGSPLSPLFPLLVT